MYKLKERKISNTSRAKLISLEEVFEDIKRNGLNETQLMPKAFLADTQEDSRTAYSFGYWGLAVYLAKGTYVYNQDYELGLISAHIPGSPDGTWFGLKPIRRLQLTMNNSGNPRKMINNALAWAYEKTYKNKAGRIHFGCLRGEEVLRSLLLMSIGQVNK